MKTALITSFLTVLSSHAALTLTNGARVVCLGDSHTDANMYNNYLECYYRMFYPTTNFYWSVEGAGGSQMVENGSTGYLDRHDRYIMPQLATHVTILGSANGSTSSNQHYLNLQLLTEKIRNTNNALPVLLGAIPTDTANGNQVTAQARSLTHVAVAQPTNYPIVNIWQELIGSPTFYGWSNNFADGHPYDLGWADSGHPGTGGHLMMAHVVIKALGEQQFISGAAIDASGGVVRWSSNCTIGSFSSTSDSATFTRLDARLPMGWDQSASNALSMCPAILTNTCWMPLIVSNLNAGTYSVKIDGVLVTNISHTDLGTTGLNIGALTTTSCSYWTQRVEVVGCIRDKCGVHRTTRATLSPLQGVRKFQSRAFASYTAGNRGQALIDDLADERAEIDAFDVLIQDAATPIARNFTIALQGAPPSEPDGATNRLTGKIIFGGKVTIQ